MQHFGSKRHQEVAIWRHLNRGFGDNFACRTNFGDTFVRQFPGDMRHFQIHFIDAATVKHTTHKRHVCLLGLFSLSLSSHVSTP